jgi:hypothetical protein
MNDRYIKSLLTVIAGALLYLCVVLTPIPAASAQTPSLRPGESSGPTEVVVVGWRPGARDVIPVTIQQTQPIRIEGAVTTERSTTRVADRVLLVGWEPGATREVQRAPRPLTESSGLPVSVPTPLPIRMTP